LLEQQISELEQEKGRIEAAFSSGTLSAEELTLHSDRFAILLKEIEIKSNRWLELSDR
jgi:ATP-binding cassette subfamily F protein uup